MEWIKSSEFPEKNKSVLVCIYKDGEIRKVNPIDITYHDGSRWCFYDADYSVYNDNVEVKYWMELPPLPTHTHVK